ncbi:oocyte zinc finger protein XlCOF6-like isoform X1 [Pieris brassicae]|uniref:oocyte zinc finger protein XlCOF6-like isoform X1 n=1 Tax=Pieris brassicae TaxID=7116 RepID=UPI001E662990|nr:oocyte zinc finger protein XlCOF6-like isoform X1 [Pieris brassicae]
MGLSSVCRCCLAEGMHRDIDIPYINDESKEIYSNMLQECFNINLSAQENSRSICLKCITRLRDAHDFKQQVAYSEKMITRVLQEKIVEAVPLKCEMESEDENCNDAEDCIFLNVVKEELNKKTKEKVKIKKPRGSKRNLALIKRTSNDKKIKNSTVNELNLIRKPPHEKDKHKENLAILLKYSNVLPFKDKSLVGFICGYCDKTYEDPLDLRHHTELDHKSQRLELYTPSDLNDYQIKLEVSNLKCTICEEHLENLQKLKDHLVNSHNKSIHIDIKDHLTPFKLTKGDSFNCIMCASTYETFKMLKQHMNVHYNNYVCHCGSTFITKRSLNAHKTTHIKGSFKCDLCEKIFSNRAKKSYHERTSHLGCRNISNCPYCDESFRSYYQRNQHLVKVHNTEAQYKCNICNKGYILKSLLMTHIKKNHMMERNYQCVECGYKFFNRKTLKAHMVKHTGEKKYACEICTKSYARKYTLREHMRIHNNDRRFKCELCGNAFVQKCSLKSHLLSHHGMSIPACEITSTS